MTVLAVLLGGVLGTAARLGLDALLPHESDGFPLATLLVNVVGAFGLGVVTARLPHRAPGWLRAGLGTGLLGSFTTFSGITVALTGLAASGGWPVAGLFLTLSLVLGIAAAMAGLATGRAGRPSRHGEEPS